MNFVDMRLNMTKANFTVIENRNKIIPKKDIKIEEYLRVAYRLLARYKRNDIDYDDFKSAANLAVAEAYNNYDPKKGHPFIAYVCTQVRQQCLSLIEYTDVAKRKNLMYALDGTDPVHQMYDTKPSALALLEHNDRLSNFHVALGKLSKRFRYIIEHRYMIPTPNTAQRPWRNRLYYKSIKDIAKTLNLSEYQVYYAEQQALKELQQDINIKGVNTMAIRPLHDRVLIKRIEEEETTAGGIIIPESAKEKPQSGVVVAIGQGTRDDFGKVIPLAVTKGDVVLFAKWGGTEIKVDGEDLLIIKESDIMAIED